MLIIFVLDFLLRKSKNPREFARLAVAESFIFNGAHARTVHENQFWYHAVSLPFNRSQEEGIYDSPMK